MKKKIKYVHPPMKWNAGAHKYEVDLPAEPYEKTKVEESKPNLLRFAMFVIIILLITGVLSWVISLII